MAKKARTYEWVIVTYGRFLVDRRAPRVTKATCTFWSQPKARETLLKRARKFDLVLQSLSVSGTCSFCTFLIIKVFESTLLRLPCAPGKFEMPWHCREDDDDGGGPPTKVPRESIDDNPTRRHTSLTRSSLPALDLEKCLLCDSKKKNEKLPKPWGTYLLYLGVFPNNSAQRCSNTVHSEIFLCSNINENFSEKTTCALGVDQLTDLHAKEVMYHASSYRKYTSPKSLDSVAIIQRLSPMTATRHGFQMSYLNDRGVDHRCVLYYESIKPHCAICMASYCEMKYRKKLSEGTVWRARVTWSKGTLTWDWSFTDLTSVQNRSMSVFSGEVQPGPIIEGCLRLDEAQEREEEKELAMKWCAWWAESQWWIRRDTACV